MNRDVPQLERGLVMWLFFDLDVGTVHVARRQQGRLGHDRRGSSALCLRWRRTMSAEEEFLQLTTDYGHGLLNLGPFRP